jgi:hypothetical protein
MPLYDLYKKSLFIVENGLYRVILKVSRKILRYGIKRMWDKIYGKAFEGRLYI